MAKSERDFTWRVVGDLEDLLAKVTKKVNGSRDLKKLKSLEYLVSRIYDKVTQLAELYKRRKAEEEKRVESERGRASR